MDNNNYTNDTNQDDEIDINSSTLFEDDQSFSEDEHTDQNNE